LIYGHWFRTHVIDRFVLASSPIQDLLRAFPGYNVKYVLVISVFRVADPIVYSYIRSCKIKVIETGFQALNEKQANLWSVIVKKAFSCLLKLTVNVASYILNKGYLIGYFLSEALAWGARKLQVYLKTNRLKGLIIKIVLLIANSILKKLSRSRRHPCYVLRWLRGVDQAVKRFGRCYFKLIRETLCEVIDRMKLWSIKMKREDGLEFSIILEEEDTQNIIPRAEKVSNSLNMALTGVHQIFRKENNSKITKKGRRGK